jgi:STE24 endopeptidase
MSEQAGDPQRQEQAREYARLARRATIFEVGLGAAFLLTVLLCGISGGLRTFLDLPQAATVALYSIILVLAYTLVSEPLSYYRSFVLPHRYGLSNQHIGDWLADEAKSLSLGLAFGTCVVVIVYQFLGTFPETWWLLGFAFVALLSIVMTRLAPVLILPLFFKLKPLNDPELRKRLVDLAERSQTTVTDVFEIDLSRKTSAGNAMLMGLGKTRRIAMSDTILRNYTPEEIETVMAHELGHHRHRDIARLIMTQSALMLLAFYLMNVTLTWAVPRLGFDGIADVAALPLLALVVSAFALLFAPLANAYSRRLETQADRYALASTGNPEAFASMLTKLSDQNLSESQPGRLTELLFYDHPPYRKRLAMAERYAREVTA